MDRRGFLTLSAAAGAALTLPEWLVFEPIHEVEPSQVVGLEVLAREITEELERLLAGYDTSVVDGAHMGVNGLTSQRCVSMVLYPEAEMLTERYVKPVAHTLANDIQFRGLRRFGRLPARSGPAQCVGITSSRISLRAVQEYDLASDWYLIRYDVLGGE